MTRLVALYPKTWRDRYEDELLALLQERHPGAMDRLDIVRGAVDARLHPELADSPQPQRPRSRQVVLTGGLVASAGLGWLAWLGLILRDFRGWGTGTPANADLIIALSLVAFLAIAAAMAAITTSFGGSIRPIGRAGVMLAAIGFVLTAFGGGMSIVVALIGVVVLAWSMADLVVPRSSTRRESPSDRCRSRSVSPG
jgi:hypothetical protein